MQDRNKEIGDISRNSIDCIEAVAAVSEQNLREPKRIGVGALATVNTFNDIKQVGTIGEIGDQINASLQDLARAPVIARIAYTDEDGTQCVIFISRTSPPPVEGFRNIASYRSPAGRIAALSPGDEFEMRIGGKLRLVVVQNVTKLHPKKRDVWDSLNTEIVFEALGAVTVASLRALRHPPVQVLDENLLDAVLAEDETPNVLPGLRKAVLSHMGLRDQPVLDKHQDEIFRFPIDTRFFLSGPPGTGKTTTLIRRLGQKLDIEALEPAERVLVQRAQVESMTPHQKSWLLFSPTELLRQYVKEAFARENVVASDEHIRTWTEYRKEIARNVLGILRTGTGGGPFVERADESYLDPRYSTSEAARWYEDFERYVRQQLFEELMTGAQWLATSGDGDLAKLGARLIAVISRYKGGFDGEVTPALAAAAEEVRRLVDQRQTEAQEIVNLSLNRILHQDRGFLDELAREIARLPIVFDDELTDEEGLEADIDEQDENEGAELASRFVSRRQATTRYEKVVRAQARAIARRRKVSEQSQGSRLLAWLGEERLPDEGQLATLAQIVTEQTQLRRFARVEQLLLRRIPALFKKFRRERAKQGIWYGAEPAKSSDICWKEIDILILAMLKMADTILAAYRREAGPIPDKGIFASIRFAYKNQVLVDEASDFSVIQLAIMRELSHPLLRSFFACGDFNQRLTEWGITSTTDLDWIDAGIGRRSITVSYRQTAKLMALAKQVAALGGAQAADIILPERVDNEGLTPVWCANLDSHKACAKWIAARIREIEIIVRTVPSIAILVNDESEVEPLAAELNESLQEMNLSAAACKDGKVVGNDRDVRVFNIQHIKGLEFEAVFFAGLDDIISTRPTLYTKYLYVGATRAATYLGATFRKGIPAEIASLSAMFEDNWPV